MISSFPAPAKGTHPRYPLCANSTAAISFSSGGLTCIYSIRLASGVGSGTDSRKAFIDSVSIMVIGSLLRLFHYYIEKDFDSFSYYLATIQLGD
jgi:hypothetical protein